MSTVLDPTPLPANDPGDIPLSLRDVDERTRRHSGEVRKLTSLLDVSQALASPVNLKSAFHRVLEILERYHGTGRSTIAIPREEGRRLHLHASVGVRAQHSDAPLGGVLAQQVFESGRPIVIPRVSHEPALAEAWARMDETDRGTRSTPRRTADDDRTYICVPVQQSRRCHGVLEVDLAFKTARNYDRSMKFYGVVASMLAGALKMQRLLEAASYCGVDFRVATVAEILGQDR